MVKFDTRDFGPCKNGKTAVLISMADGSGNIARLSSFGAALQSLLVRDRGGQLTDVSLGYDSAAGYESADGCLGSTMGRCTGRISRSRFTLSGVEYRLSDNKNGYHMHGGFEGFHKKLWEWELLSDGVRFTYVSADGEEGYPGELTAKVSYRWLRDGVLSLEYDCVSSKETVINLTNHSYFNLGGHACGSALGQRLQIFSHAVAALGENTIPTGELTDIAGTPLDFRKSTVIGDRIYSDYALIRKVGGYDHCYVIDGSGMRPAAVLSSDATGIEMCVSTDLPVLGLYTANFLSRRRGKGGAVYDSFGGVCLETEFMPNAVNLPEYAPRPVFKAGEHYRFTTLFAFRSI
ncbi:MAG: aldose epimerase family protein [Candidatus Limivicinus sp.]|nr:galactose mutarotase [Clostridiales bacterium]MDY3859072.1 aldose epimerase family protein [Candidatus Limivicinus sp.]